MTSASMQATRQAAQLPVAATPTHSSPPSCGGSEDPFSVAMYTAATNPYYGEDCDSTEEVGAKLGQVGLWIDTHNFTFWFFFFKSKIYIAVLDRSPFTEYKQM
jgi:hypothetical protein